MLPVARDAVAVPELDESQNVEHAITKSSESHAKPGTLRRISLIAVLCGVVILSIASAGRAFDSRYDGRPLNSGPDGASLASLITKLRQEKKLVALAAMVMVDGKVVATAADGERKKGSGVPVQLGDRWHLGSITKSITATMIARLIESGRMTWSDSLAKSFPGASIHEDWKPVTLQQLLTHTAGAPANFSFDVMLQQPKLGPECTQARRKAVLALIAKKPAYAPGTRFLYSNAGYSIAAAMAEAATGKSWNELVKQEVFGPLELTGAGFGVPKSSSGALDQPRGHRLILGRKQSDDDETDNTFIIGPAGAVHMTLADLCKYAAEHLQGEQGKGKLLNAESYKRLHTPQRSHYAYGWVLNEPRYEIPHPTYWHNGSNTMWYALVVFIPDKNMVAAVTSNDGDIEGAESAAWKIVETFANRFHVEGDAARRQSLPSRAFPQKSAFTAVRWRSDAPEVRVGKEWFQLVSLDGIPAGDIMTFCRRTDKDRWHKGFEEHLFEVLFRMGHEPKDAVQLVVRPVGSSDTKTLEHVSMTEANRRAIKAAANANRQTLPKAASGR